MIALSGYRDTDEKQNWPRNLNERYDVTAEIFFVILSKIATES